MAAPIRNKRQLDDQMADVGDVLDDGAIAGVEVTEIAQPDRDEPRRDDPADDALVDSLGDTVDVRDLPPSVGQTQPGPAPAPKPVAPRVSRADRREQRREDRAAERRATDPVLAPLARKEDQSLREYLEQLTEGRTEVKISLRRETPERHQGVKCNGLLDNYFRLIDEAEIKETHGGGKFYLSIYRRGPNGDWKYLKNTTIEIAGDPKVEGLKIRDEPSAPAASGGDKTESTVVGRVLDMFDRQGRERQSGPDMAVINAMMAPMRAQLDAFQRAIESKDKELAALRDKPTDPYKDKFVEKLIDQDSARIAAIKTQHDAELRTLKENSRADLERERDRAERETTRITAQYDREISTMKDAHHREVAFMKETHARELASLKQGYENQLQLMKTTETVTTRISEGESKRLERENDRLGKELAELRAKKEQTITEKVKELEGIKDLLSNDNDDEDKGVIAKFMESPIAGKIVEKIGGAFGGGQPAPQQVVPGQVPPGVPFHLPDGRLAMRDEQGNIRVKRTAPAQPAPGSPPPGTAPTAEDPMAGIDPQQVKDAIAFMEGAYRSNTAPKDFAASVRNMVPPGVLKLLAAHGVDEFFDKVAGLEASSPLNGQGGRVWARKVATALTGSDD